MLKKFITKKITLIIFISFSFCLISMIPEKEELNTKQELNYVSYSGEKSVIYLLDDNNYLARTVVAVSNNEIEEKARELLEVLIKGGKGESKIPNGFKSIIPSETEIKSIEYKDGIIKVNFSSEFLDTSIKTEEKIVEAIIYTLTSIENVDKVIIYVDGDILTKLPKTGINLPSILDKSYGINKEYDLETYKDVSKVTIFYVSKYNDNYYYVPVTKYINDDRDKIKIIVDELASSKFYDSNLMSFLNNNTVLLSSELNDQSLSLVFNQYIFSDLDTKNILEEVIYTISLSIDANYNVDEVIFNVENEEIYKSVIKLLEKS